METNQTAPVKAEAERMIHAPLDLVWSVQTDFEGWVEWNPDVSAMAMRGPVAPGTEFRWKAGGASIVSTIQEVEPGKKIVWTGRTMGIRAIHMWTFHEEREGVRVRTAESFEGLVARVLARPLKKMLARSLGGGLEALAAECHRRAGNRGG